LTFLPALGRPAVTGVIWQVISNSFVELYDFSCVLFELHPCHFATKVQAEGKRKQCLPPRKHEESSNTSCDQQDGTQKPSLDIVHKVKKAAKQYDKQEEAQIGQVVHILIKSKNILYLIR
jgi:hypothetical protein